MKLMSLNCGLNSIHVIELQIELKIIRMLLKHKAWRKFLKKDAEKQGRLTLHDHRYAERCWILCEVDEEENFRGRVTNKRNQKFILPKGIILNSDHPRSQGFSGPSPGDRYLARETTREDQRVKMMIILIFWHIREIPLPHPAPPPPSH